MDGDISIYIYMCVCVCERERRERRERVAGLTTSWGNLKNRKSILSMVDLEYICVICRLIRLRAIQRLVR